MGWGIQPGATVLQPAALSALRSKRLPPRAGGAWGTLDPAQAPRLRGRYYLLPETPRGLGSWGWVRVTNWAPLQGHPKPKARRLTTQAGSPRAPTASQAGPHSLSFQPPTTIRVTQLGGAQPIAGPTADGHPPQAGQGRSQRQEKPRPKFTSEMTPYNSPSPRKRIQLLGPTEAVQPQSCPVPRELDLRLQAQGLWAGLAQRSKPGNPGTWTP